MKMAMWIIRGSQKSAKRQEKRLEISEIDKSALRMNRQDEVDQLLVLIGF